MKGRMDMDRGSNGTGYSGLTPEDTRALGRKPDVDVDRLSSLVKDRLQIYTGVRIAGATAIYPDRIISNDEMISADENLKKYHSRIIVERVGVETRHRARPDDYAAETIATASELALKETGIGKDQVEKMIVCPNPPDFITPPVSSMVHGLLELPAGVPGIDLNMACTGFLSALGYALALMQHPDGPRVVLVGGNNNMSRIQYAVPANSLIFGDGAGAVVLGKTAPDSGHDWSMHLYILGYEWPMIVCPFPNQITPIKDPISRNAERGFVMDGPYEDFREIMYRDFGPRIKWFFERKETQGLKLNKGFVHQPSRYLFEDCVDLVVRYSDIDRERIHRNLHKYGNLISAEVPSSLHDSIHDGTLRRGDLFYRHIYGAGVTGAQMITRF